jgi:hypothetical protein
MSDNKGVLARVWSGMKQKRGAWPECIQPPGGVQKFSIGSNCFKEEDISCYIDPHSIRDKKLQAHFFQEIYTDETCNLLMDLDTPKDKPCKSLEEAKALELKWAETVVDLCQQKLGMTKRDAQRNIALCSGSGEVDGGFKGSLHVCINSVKMVWGHQKDFFKNNQWDKHIPIDYSIYRTKGLIKLPNSSKQDDKYKRVKTYIHLAGAGCSKQPMMHIPTVGLQDCKLIPESKPPTPAKESRKSKTMTETDEQLVTRVSRKGGPLDKHEVKFLLSCISPNIQYAPNGWLNVMNFMRFSCVFDEDDIELDDKGQYDKGSKELFFEWSKTADPPYDCDLEMKWMALNMDCGFDLDYIRKLAQSTLDGKRKFDMFVNRSCTADVMKSMKSNDPNFGDADVAKIMKTMMPNYVYDGRAKSTETFRSLYCVDDGGIYIVKYKKDVQKWIGQKILPYMNKSIVPAIANRVAALQNMEDETEDDEWVKLAEAQELITLCGVPKVRKGFVAYVDLMITGLHTSQMKARIYDSFTTEVTQTDPPLLELFNTMDNLEFLFPFTNGVVDLQTMQFRPAKPEEYVFHTCEYEYRPADPEKKKWLMDELSNMYANDDQLMIKLISISAALRGRNIFQQFLFDTGTGGNAKGTMWELVAHTFGKLAGTVEPSVLQKEDPRPDAATSYLAMLRYCRIVTCADPDSKHTLKLSLIKRLSGGDKIKARGLYENSFEFVCQFYIWMQTNKMPPLDDDVRGDADRRSVDRRLVVTHGPFDFGGKDKGSPTWKKGSLEIRSMFESDKDVRDAFMDILLSVYKLYCIPIFAAGDSGGEGVTQIRDIGKPGTGTEHLGVKYDPYWETILETYKGKSDTVSVFMQKYYIKTTPNGYKQNEKYFLLESGGVPVKGARKRLLTEDKDYTSCFTSNFERVSVSELHKTYLASISKAQKAEAVILPVFKEKVIYLGFGITKTEFGTEYVFGCKEKDDDDDDDTGEKVTVQNPYNNTMGPNKGPGSHYAKILACKPLEGDMTLTTAKEEIVEQDDGPLSQLPASELPSDDDDDEAKKQQAQDDAEYDHEIENEYNPQEQEHGTSTEVGKTDHSGEFSTDCYLSEYLKNKYNLLTGDINNEEEHQVDTPVVDTSSEEEDADPKQMIEYFLKLVDDGFDDMLNVWDAMDKQFYNWDDSDGIEPLGVLCGVDGVVALEGPNGYRIFNSGDFEEYDIKHIFDEVDPAQQWNQDEKCWMDVDVPDYEPAPDAAGPVKKVSPPKNSPITGKLQPKVMLFLQTCSDDQYKKFTEHMCVDKGQVHKWKTGNGIGKKYSEKIKDYINNTAVYGDLTKGYKYSVSDKGVDWVCIEGKDFKVSSYSFGSEHVQFIYVMRLDSGKDTKSLKKTMVGIIDKKDGLAHFTEKGKKYQK